MTKVFYKKADGFGLVFDLSDKKSFESINVWLNSLAESAPENVCKILIGNKNDLSD